MINVVPIRDVKCIDDAVGKIVCGDCRELFPKLPEKSIGLVIQDPPYGDVLDVDWDDRSSFREVQEMLAPKLSDRASIYTWCGIGEKSQSLIDFFIILREFFHFKDLITWKKRRGIGMRKGWLYAREEILWHVVDNNKFVWNTKYQYSDEPNQFSVGMSGYRCKSKFKRIPNVWTDIPEKLVHGIKHLTPKPIEALLRMIRVHYFEGCIVLDPFAGSFSTAVACEMLGVPWICCEINRDYCEVGLERLADSNKHLFTAEGGATWSLKSHTI